MKGRPIKSGDGLRAEQRSGGRGGASMKGRPIKSSDRVPILGPVTSGFAVWTRMLARAGLRYRLFWTGNDGGR